MNDEVWKDVPGYEGLYKVSSHGRVYSSVTNKIMKSSESSHGYLVVQLSNHGKSREWKVHRLVAISFIPNPFNLPQVNHKDLDKKNNFVENLEWCTLKFNIEHASRNGRRTAGATGTLSPNHKLTESDVREIRRQLNLGISGAQIARKYNVDNTTIYNIKHGETWKDVK